MKRIRDRVAGLDVHRDTVVACCRVVEPDGEVAVTKESFATTRRGLGELAYKGRRSSSSSGRSNRATRCTS
jgi:transposase